MSEQAPVLPSGKTIEAARAARLVFTVTLADPDRPECIPIEPRQGDGTRIVVLCDESALGEPRRCGGAS